MICLLWPYLYSLIINMEKYVFVKLTFLVSLSNIKNHFLFGEYLYEAICRSVRNMKHDGSWLVSSVLSYIHIWVYPCEVASRFGDHVQI
jgi:hypothetical protein